MTWRLATLVLALCLVLTGCAGPAASGTQRASDAGAARPWPSPADLVAIQSLIASRAGPTLRSVGQGRNVVEVSLAPNGVSLARELVAAYGSAVHVTVGFQEFPAGALTDQACGTHWSTVTRTDVRAKLELSSTRIASGTDFRATVRISAVDKRTVFVETGEPLVVYLFRPATLTPVAAFDGSIAGVGLSIAVSPSTPGKVAALGSTASCDPALGYALKPGAYEARAFVEDGSFDHSRSFWTEPLAIEVVAP